MSTQLFLLPPPLSHVSMWHFFYSDCSGALSFASRAEVSGEGVFHAGWQEAYGARGTISEGS